MLFIPNKYTTTYYSIITQAKDRVNDGYVENHHIIPKSLGGNDDDDNIVALTAKEHFICHRLLVYMTEGANRAKMRYALLMFGYKNPKHERYNLTPRQYQLVKEQRSLANKDRPGPNRGRKLSEEWKANISKAGKGKKQKPRTEEHAKKLGQYERTEEHRQKLRDTRRAMTGKYNHSEETKRKIGEASKGKTMERFVCSKCGKEVGGKANLSRWHEDNCKYA